MLALLALTGCGVPALAPATAALVLGLYQASPPIIDAIDRAMAPDTPASEVNQSCQTPTK
jgi:hypothetical protein